MREYEIIYISQEAGHNQIMSGSGVGQTEEEAIKDFLFWHDDCVKIVNIKPYE